MENNSVWWDLRLPHSLCHSLWPWPEWPWEAGGHWEGSWVSFIKKELCVHQNQLCLASQGTAKGDDWKNSFKSSVNPKHRCCWMLAHPPRFLLLNCSWRKLEFASESCPVCSLGRIKQSFFRQQHTKWLKLLSKWTYNSSGSYNLVLL